MVVQSGCQTGFADGTFTAAAVEFTAEFPPTEPHNMPTQYNPWVGIGQGLDPEFDQLVQAGIEADAYTGSNSSQLYFPWTEVYPFQSVQYHGLPSNIRTGDSIFVEVWYLAGTAWFYLDDESQSGDDGEWSTNYQGATGGSAEWVIEKQGGHYPLPLSHWANPFIMRGSEALMNGTWTCAGVPPHVSVLLYQGPTLLAKGGAWTDPGSYCDFPITRTNRY